MTDKVEFSTREFLCKETHDNLCGCGSGSYRSNCHTRALVEGQINTAYKYGQVSILSQVIKSLNKYISESLEFNMENRADTAELIKAAIINEIDTECK